MRLLPLKSVCGFKPDSIPCIQLTLTFKNLHFSAVKENKGISNPLRDLYGEMHEIMHVKCLVYSTYSVNFRQYYYKKSIM